MKLDEGLRKWMDACGEPEHGNVRGLPEVDTRAELAKVLTSILYRVTVHGAGSLSPSVNPALSWVANFPPCLQRAEIPALDENLPNTGTIGGMTTFYYTFVYSQPYKPLIPKGGPTADPHFERQNCKDALIAYRQRIEGFVTEYGRAWNETLARIRGTSAGPLPGYAQHQAEQWPLSIEI